jgi:hypothetical protein
LGPGAPLHGRPSPPGDCRATPCTLLIDEIETLWAAIAEHDDWSLFEAKLGAIAELREALGLAAQASPVAGC